MGDHNDSFGGRGQYLIVLTKEAGMIEPGKRPLHNPAPGKLLSFVRLFLKLKNNRRFATRYEKKALYFHAVVCLACILVWLL